MKRLSILSVLLFSSCITIIKNPVPASPAPPAVPAPPATIDVVIDHEAGTISPAGLIRKRPGDNLHIQIQHTSRTCFSYNVLVQPTSNQPATTPPQVALDQVVDFNVRYDGDPVTISVAAYPLNAPGCPSLPDRQPGKNPGPWEVRVANDGWDLAFSGAFTADHLTDPSFALEESTTTTSAGTMFKITKTERDSVRLGSAAMVHLYHTEPDPLGRRGVNWVPFSFGLGVGDTAHVRYYLGTGIRFDKRLFLTVGGVLGSTKVLPKGKHVGDMTTDANLLNSTGSRTAGKLFFSVSYSFIGVGPDAFKGSFASALAPLPTVPATSTSGVPPSPFDIDSTLPTAGDTTFTYKLNVKNKRGPDAKDLSLSHDFPAPAKGTWTVSPSGGATCGDAQGSPQDKLKIDKKISLPKDEQCVYIIKLTGISPADLPVSNAQTTLTAADGTTKVYDKVVNVKLKP